MNNHLVTSRRTHCRRCGRLLCNRCVSQKAALPGHESKRPVPVCNDCHKALEQERKARAKFRQRQEDSGAL